MFATIAAFAAIASAPAAAELELRVERLRGLRGDLHLCLTRNPAHFPDCRGDPAAVTRTLPAARAADGPIRIAGLPPGGWALSLLHDENRNGRLDTVAGIPREGFGFSRNPAVRFGPPRFDQVRIDLGPGITRQTVRMQYVL